MTHEELEGHEVRLFPSVHILQHAGSRVAGSIILAGYGASGIRVWENRGSCCGRTWRSHRVVTPK